MKLKRKISPKIKKIFKWISLTLVALTVIFFWGGEIQNILREDSEEEYYEEKESYQDEWQDCDIAVIKLQGNLYTYIPVADKDADGYPLYDEISSEDIVYEIEQAETDDDIKAIILEIDSTGGAPVAAEEVANALQRATKLTVALIRESGASAAYYAASGADIIFASENSDVGSIGVTTSYVSNSDKNQKEGLMYNQLIAGKFKDMGNPDKILTSEEKRLIMRDIKIVHENFIKTVAENRDLEIDKVRKLADGSSMLGQMALENGLIDKIGGLDEVMEYLLGKFDEGIKACW